MMMRNHSNPQGYATYIHSTRTQQTKLFSKEPRITCWEMKTKGVQEVIIIIIIIHHLKSLSDNQTTR